MSRHEERTIRPFVGLGDLQGLFDECSLTVNGLKATQNTHFLETQDFENIKLELSTYWHLSDLKESLKVLRLSEDDVFYAIYIYGRTLKQLEIVRNLAIRELDNLEVLISLEADDAPRVLGDYSAGFDVVMAIYLKNGRESKPLTVSEPGTWLAKKEFHIRPQVGQRIVFPHFHECGQKEGVRHPHHFSGAC